MGEFGERGSDVPWWVKHPLFKGLVVAGLIMGALSPVFLKVMLLVWGGGSFYVPCYLFCCLLFCVIPKPRGFARSRPPRAMVGRSLADAFFFC